MIDPARTHLRKHAPSRTVSRLSRVGLLRSAGPTA